MFTGSHSPRRVVRPPDQGVLNDGREHSLRIERLPGRLCACLLCLHQSRTTRSDPGMGFFFVRLRSFAVQVDEEAKRETTLPNDQPVNLHRIFLGGIPAEVEQTSNRVNVPFQGCIWNLMINTMYVVEIQFTSIPEVIMKLTFLGCISTPPKRPSDTIKRNRI